MGSKVLPREAYTIGWISPLEIEYTAALVMLDEEHAPLGERPGADENIYGLGTIAGHNIVVASLPVMGNNTAATVATQMRNTFPNVQYILLVGIGGGVPSTTDNGVIRLGDVVVSKPMNGHSGAVQYDHGKAQVGHFRCTGALAAPPRLLLNAAGDLAAKSARMRKDPVAQHLKRFDTTLKKLKRYAFPGSARDHLYETSYIHLDPKKSCIACGCDPVRRVPRETFDFPETEDENEPMIVVHRGTIASGELVIKNGVLRDQLAEQYDILCFEMEAAGALAGSNCLVIRGISDYCDSHKNNEWHGYAAAAAAAYARQLLFHIPRLETKDPTTLPVESNDQMVKERQMILDWLTTTNFASHLHDLLTLRQPGTGKWFLESHVFQAWRRTSEQTLYCTGIPGAGKTILMATVVDHLITSNGSNPGVGIAYLFCNAKLKQNQTSPQLMLSLLKQLAQTKSPLPEVVVKLYRTFAIRKALPSLQVVIEALQAVISAFFTVYIVVDAVDECHSPQGDYGPFLTTLLGLQQTTSAHILVTSRYSKHIERYFDGAGRAEIRANTDDLNSYLDSHILQLSATVRHDAELQQRIKQNIMKAADGMFLLAKLLLDNLRDKTSRNAIMKTLGKLPDGENALAMAYQEAIDRIRDQRAGFKDLALRVLCWLVHAKRPLTTRELQHALAVGTSTSCVDPGDIEDVHDMVSVCAGIVTVDGGTEIIRLVHYTAQEYLWNLKDDLFPGAEAHTTQTCLRYLSLDAFAHGPFENVKKMEDAIRAYPFGQYAAQFWGEHAVTSDFLTYKEPSLALLESSPKLEVLAQLMQLVGGFAGRRADEGPQYVSGTSNVDYADTKVTGLQIAAIFNLSELAGAILDGGADIDQEDKNGWTALHRAAAGNSGRAVRLLLDSGANIDHRARYGGTALHCAATNGHAAVVALLLQRGALRDSEDDYGGTALHRAAKGGHVEAAQLLIFHGADVDRAYDGDVTRHMQLEQIKRIQERTDTRTQIPGYPKYQPRTEEDELESIRRQYTGTALHQAVRMGHGELISLLLESKADPFCLTPLGETLLHLAAQTGNEHIMEILLSSETALLLNQEDTTGSTPLAVAARKGRKGVVEILLNRSGIDIERGKPLREAVLNGNCDILDMFLGKKMNVTTALGCIAPEVTPLDLIFQGDSMPVFRRFLEAGHIRLDDTNDPGYSSLSLAAKYGSLSLFKFILEKGQVDINRCYPDGRTLLSLAAEGGDTTIARLILNRDPAQLNALDSNLCSSLWWASRSGAVEMVKFFLESEDHTLGVEGNSPLIPAACRGDEAIVALLLAKCSTDLSARDHHGISALRGALSYGTERVVVMLLEAGCLQPGDPDEWQNTLREAIRKDSWQIAEALFSLTWVDISSKEIMTDWDLRSLCNLAVDWDSEIIIRALSTSPGAIPPLRQGWHKIGFIYRLIKRLEFDGVKIPGGACPSQSPIATNWGRLPMHCEGRPCRYAEAAPAWNHWPNWSPLVQCNCSVGHRPLGPCYPQVTSEHGMLGFEFTRPRRPYTLTRCDQISENGEDSPGHGSGHCITGNMSEHQIIAAIQTRHLRPSSRQIWEFRDSQVIDYRCYYHSRRHGTESAPCRPCGAHGIGEASYQCRNNKSLGFEQLLEQSHCLHCTGWSCICHENSANVFNLQF